MNLSAPYTAAKATVLIVDDDLQATALLASALSPVFNIHLATNVVEAEDILRFEYVQILLFKPQSRDAVGIHFLNSVQMQWSGVVRVMVFDADNEQDAIDAMRHLGITHYIEKPYQIEKLHLVLMQAVAHFELQRQNHLLTVELKVATEQSQSLPQVRRLAATTTFQCSDIVRTAGGTMDLLVKQACQIAAFDFPVVITGSSGTGKELIAKVIHVNSPRAAQPFIAENCGAMPDQLLESELFGYKKGAFTGAHANHIGLLEQANGGTLFLDEVGELSPAFQVKLLRVLQEQEVRPIGQAQAKKIDIRVLAATNRNLEDEVRAGRFREDLFYRLSAYSLRLPDLCERVDDIPLIANALLAQMSARYLRENRGFEDEAMACLLRYTWPGNIREMQNEIARMFMLTPIGRPLSAAFLSPKVLLATSGVMTHSVQTLDADSLKARVGLFEKQIIQEALTRLDWNRTNVAIELGLSRVGLRKKMLRYGLESGEHTFVEDEIEADN
jgi:two-component system response regulator HupR/HoxA